MTALNWPATLPLPSIAGYAIKPDPNLDRTEMESGTARQRLNSTSTRDGIPVQFELTLWEQAIFESWYVHKARQGACWFNVTLLGGMGLVVHEARFKGGTDVVYTPRTAQHWVVTATLEIRDRPMLSASDLDLLLAEDDDALFRAIAAIHRTVTEDLWSEDT